MYRLRRFQKDAVEMAKEMAVGGGKKNILAEITPGGGKSALPQIYGHYLREANLIDKIMWVVPRLSLKRQGADSFIQSGEYSMRNIIGHELAGCSGDNSTFPSNGNQAYTITYQGLASNIKPHLNELDESRFLIVLDEAHHVTHGHAKGGDVSEHSITPLVEHPNAKYLLIMTGTAERHDANKMAFIPYKKDGGRWIIDEEDPEWDFLNYKRAEAIEDGAKLPITFQTVDASGEYMDKAGQLIEFETLRDEIDHDVNSQYKLGKALDTDYAFSMLERGVKEYKRHLEFNRRSQLIIIASSQDHARRYKEYIDDNYSFNTALAISDNPESQEMITRFRHGQRKVLVTVGMAHEGLDAPGASVMVVLTKIRSKPWLEQAFDRITRVDFAPSAPHRTSQTATVIVPADELMSEAIEMILDEQAVEPVVKEELVERISSLEHAEPVPDLSEAIDGDIAFVEHYEEVERVIMSDEEREFWISEAGKLGVNMVDSFTIKKLLGISTNYPGDSKGKVVYTHSRVKTVMSTIGGELHVKLMTTARSVCISKTGEIPRDGEVLDVIVEAFKLYGKDLHRARPKDIGVIINILENLVEKGAA